MSRIDRSAFLYLAPRPPKDAFAQCGTCDHFLPGSQRCAILDNTTEIQAGDSCGMYLHGAPHEQPIVNRLSFQEMGFVRAQVRCENCVFGGSNCKLYESLNRTLPDKFDLDTKIESQACCNAWQSAKDAKGDPMNVQGKSLTSKQRDDLPASDFAVPGKRKLPIHDEAHVRAAMSRFGQTEGLTPSERATARRRIIARAKKFGIDTSGFEKMHASAAFRLMAMSLNIPKADGTHPNRMPFTGILTRVGVPSDAAPHGSGGKRVLITPKAAEAALPSLLGMGVGLTAQFDGHDPTKKIGVITAAHIEGDALKIEGFVYAADFQREAVQIQMNKADLGFSFEAQGITVENVDADPLVVESIVFTGAAILMKDAAAYRTTALAAAAAQEKEMNEEILAAVKESVTGAIAPINETVNALKTGLEAQNTALTELRQKVEAGATGQGQPQGVAALVENHAKALEAAAEGMEKSGLGLNPSSGHAAHLRRMAAHIRAEASLGRLPTEYLGLLPQGGFPAGFQASGAGNGNGGGAQPKIEDDPAFKALKAQLEEATGKLNAATDEASSAKTKIADLEKQVQNMQPAPQRKTLPPIVASVLARGGIDVPEGDKKLSLAQIDAALDRSGTSAFEGARVKREMANLGLIDAVG